MKTFLSAFVAIGAFLSASVPVMATPIPNGNVSSVDTFNPAVSVATDPSTYSAFGGGTLQLSATGGFAGAGGGTGTLNGTLSFSDTAGVTLNQVLNDFFVFSDGQNGTFNFSVASVLTQAFTDAPGTTTSGTLYVLGTTTDANLQYAPTATSLTVSFNSTGSSAFSSSLSLAVPPAPLAVPEPASVVLLGMGLVTAGLVRRFRAS